MVGILVVSHSAEAARGIVAIAGQMAGDGVPLDGCGGTDEGGLGTSVPAIVAAIEGLLARSDGVVVIPDLGSAVLAARTAMELVDSDIGKIVIADGPILEGALMASVEASIGAGLDRVAQVVGEARDLRKLQD